VKPHVKENTIPGIVDALQRRVDIHLPMIDGVDDILDPGNENSEWIARDLIQIELEHHLVSF